MRRRARWLPVAGLLVLALCQVVLHAGAGALAGTAFLLAGSSAYGYVVHVLQARRRFAALMAYQAANGLLFVAAAVAVLIWGGAPSLAAMLAGPAAALCVLGGTGLLRLPTMQPLVEHRTATGAPLPFCTDDPGALLTATGWRPRSVLDVGQPGANFGRLTPVPAGWDGGADPTTRSYLLVGTRG